MEGSYWVVLVCPRTTLQYTVHQKQGQVEESTNSASAAHHGDIDHATDSSQSGAVCSTP